MESNIIAREAVSTIPSLFRERLRLSPQQIAYRQYDIASQQWSASTWQQMSNEVARWQAGFGKEQLQPGDRVALMMKNGREWVVCDQAALGLGLVTVPLYVEDRPDNVAYIINHADVKLLFVQDKPQWKRLLDSGADLGGLKRIISINRISEDDEPNDPRLESLADWLFGLHGQLQSHDGDADALASIVYTSGTTGRSKGVMLSHKNMLSNAHGALQCDQWKGEQQVFLSFLPLSHMLERTAGYYMPMFLGAQVAYARSIPQLGDDLINIKPTVLISVPRIYERVFGKIQDGLKKKSALERKLFHSAVSIGWKRFEYLQGRAAWRPSLLMWPLLNKLVAGKVLEKLGGRMHLAICGGAALSPEVARTFIGLGLTLLQGYGLTESSPVISVNRPDDNIPESIGLALPGIDVRIGENDELQSRSDCVMLGYWRNEQATQDSFTDDGWLRTGDKARIDDAGHLYITGRLKDIIVLANGEKVPPNDMEMSISIDSLFEQVMIIGEARPYLSAILVLDPDRWADFAQEHGVHPEAADAFKQKVIERAVLGRVGARLKDFPGYAQIRKITMTLEPWSVDNGLLTPTLKVKRPKVMEKYAAEINDMYKGHSL